MVALRAVPIVPFSLVYSPKGYAPDAAGVNGPVGFSLFI